MLGSTGGNYGNKTMISLEKAGIGDKEYETMYEKTGGRTAGVRADGHAAAGWIHGLICGLGKLSFSDPTASVGDQHLSR